MTYKYKWLLLLKFCHFILVNNLDWAELDSNQRSVTQRIYNPPPLTTRTPTLTTLILYHILKEKTILEF
jgi:hypothetical protein